METHDSIDSAIDQTIRRALALKASDLHLSAGLPPIARAHGVQQVLQQLMTPARWTAFQAQLEDDFAFTHPDRGRWRINAFHQHRGAALVMRFIPAAVPRLAELQAPSLLSGLALQAHGLILVTGPTGCGKSTLLAALLDQANRTLQGHLLTIETPPSLYIPRSNAPSISAKWACTAAALRPLCDRPCAKTRT